ncbi:hypothetical protein OCF84_21520 (plasmid) [Shewanella xiamenensis]|uniref:Uncharacterized protein n=1 Tax=Shewanella xiamenensis TaxID=332186 RepID=A0ABT6UDK6_9GAMM|nr:hypothetical protein [Shewanella xiamenensis]MDI5832543.1 hypothetical protein [Shewanella xiamenensis]WHF57839.1 hypothetical protein OCF84_21520 [Shewanella xiamenensis]
MNDKERNGLLIPFIVLNVLTLLHFSDFFAPRENVEAVTQLNGIISLLWFAYTLGVWVFIFIKLRKQKRKK